MSAAPAPVIHQLDFEAVRQILPHRYPCLMVDRVPEIEPGSRIVALKNVTANEPYVTGHFPNQAVMPGVLIVEAAAQAVGILRRYGTNDTGDGYLAHAAMSFRHMVIPGDQMLIEAVVQRRMGKLLNAKVKVRVAGTVVAEGELTVYCEVKEEVR